MLISDHARHLDRLRLEREHRENSPESKAALRQKLQADIARFLAAGGQPTQLPTNAHQYQGGLVTSTDTTRELGKPHIRKTPRKNHGR